MTAIIDCTPPEAATGAGARAVRRGREPNRRASARAADRALVHWSLFAAAALALALAAPLLAGRVYVADDLAQFHLPLRQFYADQLARGEPFDWLPTLYCGFYLTGEGQLGGYHPLHLALYRWLPLWMAFDLELLAGYPALLLGTFLLLRRGVKRPGAALFGALAFTFGSFNLLHFAHPNGIAVTAHVPWLLWLETIALTAPSRRRAALAWFAVGACTASQLLLGYPQYVWLSLLAETALGLWLLAGRNRPATALPPDWPRRTGALVTAKVLGIAAGGIQLLPTLDALAASTRYAADATFAGTGSLHPLNLVQLVAPYLFATRVVGENTHELGLYAGAVPLAACAWLASSLGGPTARTPLLPFLLSAGALALLLACGEHGGLHWLTAWLPGVNRLRFSCRAIVLVQLALAAVTAIALVQMARYGPATRPSRRALAVPVVASLVAVIAGWALWREYLAQWWLVAAGPVLAAAAAWLVARAAGGRHWAWAALVVFTALDLGAYGLSCHIWPSTARLDEFIAATDVPPGASQPSAQQAPLRVAADRIDREQPQLRTGNRVLLAGWARIDGYAGLEPLCRLDYREPAVQRLAGARWSRTSPPDVPAWTCVADPLPRARLATRIVDDANLRPLPAELLGPTAAVAAEEELALAEDSPPGTVTIERDRPGQIDLVADAPAAQLLIVAESYHPGWQATVDGQPAPVVRVDGDFLGVRVLAGQRRIELRFRAASLRAGAALSACGVGLLMVGLVASLLRAPRRAASGNRCV